jgi:OTU-like cysteine protease
MGNCLFESLNHTYQLSSFHMLRVRLCEYVYQHASIFIEEIRSNGFTSVEDYIRHMVRNGVDGDHTMITAASLLFPNVEIQIVMPNRKVYIPHPNPDATKTAILSWVPGHYSVFQ